jgi:hypothetical protein
LIFDFPPFAPVMPAYISTVQTNTGDLVTSFYPYRTLAARAVREGTLPLWNPYMLSGAPFLANAQSALFYPGNFPYYLLPVPISWAIGFFLRRVLWISHSVAGTGDVGCRHLASSHVLFGHAPAP